VFTVDQIFVVKLESVSTRGWLHFFGQCNMSDDLHEMYFVVGQGKIDRPVFSCIGFISAYIITDIFFLKKLHLNNCNVIREIRTIHHM
jgi:hypothetical protein